MATEGQQGARVAVEDGGKAGIVAIAHAPHERGVVKASDGSPTAEAHRRRALGNLRGCANSHLRIIAAFVVTSKPLLLSRRGAGREAGMTARFGSLPTDSL